ncbi:MAG: ATP-binding protein [Rheinheimera sp.]|nr:ATP-binding protein [Rheinheimera sp.]
MSEPYDYSRAWQREKLARQQAELLLQDKTRALYDKVLELEASKHELEQAHEQLLQTQKLQAIGQLTAGLAHEINNPLAFCLADIRTMAEYQQRLSMMLADVVQQYPDTATLLQRANSDWLLADSADIVTQLEAGMGRIQQIVAQLHHFSVLGQSAAARMSLAQLWNNVWMNIAPSRLTEIEVQQQLCDVMVEVHCTEMVTALTHIVDNALKAQPSCIRLHCQRQSKERVAVVIEDNGYGMSAEVLPRIFDPFFTTRDVGDGRGLGLTVSYAIVRQHGGQIEFHSSPGAGTRCTITLPCTDD